MILTLCPHCLKPYTPVEDDAFGAECPHCARDTSLVDPLGMDDESYQEAATKECLYCGARVLVEAEACPDCKAELPVL